MTKQYKHDGIIDDVIIGRIYKIFNTEDEMVYIGSTNKTLIKRWGDHMYSLNKDENMKLYKHIKIIGLNKFRMKLLEWKHVDNTFELRQLEQKWMNRENPINLLNSKKSSITNLSYI